MRTFPLAWGAAVGLADFIVHAAREKRGSAQGWVAALRYLSTGQGQPGGSIVLADPAANLAAELAVELGDPNAGTLTAQPAALSLNLPDVMAGARLVTSFLCYRDGGAARSEASIRDWLSERPASVAGFVITLTTVVGLVLIGEVGSREESLLITGEFTQQMVGSQPDPERGVVESVAEFTEGWRSAAALLGHWTRDDEDAASALLRRIVRTWSLSWGTILGLTEITMATLEWAGYDSAEFIHFIHSHHTSAMAHAEPQVKTSA